MYVYKLKFLRAVKALISDRVAKLCILRPYSKLTISVHWFDVISEHHVVDDYTKYSASQSWPDGNIVTWPSSLT